MHVIGTLVQDLRHGLRLCAKTPGFVAIAVLSIGFGTGANVAMFSAADALLLRPLPVNRPDELLTVGTQIGSGLEVRTVASHPDFKDLQQRSGSFSGFAAFTSRAIPYAPTPDAVPRPQVVTFVNADFFRALEVSPTLGRTFHREEDEVEGRDAVMILDHGLWIRDFAGDPRVVGRKVRSAGIEFTVVGVLPQEFTGMEPRYVRHAAYVPLAMLPRVVASESGNPLILRDMRILTVKGRLKPGVSMTHAKVEIDGISQDLARMYPRENRRTAFTIQTELELTLAQEPFDAGLLAILSMLSISVLAVACANVAGLLASRAAVRGREVALRLAIGAGRSRILRQLFVESAIIAAAGTALGVLVGYLGIKVIDQIKMPTDVFSYPEFRLDARVLLFSLVLAGASALLFGVAPAIQTVRVDLMSALKPGDSLSRKRRPLTARSFLVAGQVALSLVVVTIAVFAFEGFRRHLGRGPGFRTERAAKVTIDAGERGTDAAKVDYYQRVLTAVRSLPVVTSATVTSAMPLFSYQPGALVPEHYSLPPGESALKTLFNSVDEAYFATLEIPILKGRGFTANDDARSARVAVVNEVAARRYWPGRDPVGRRFRLHDSEGPLVEVVGVARTAKYHYFLEPPTEMVYLPFRQSPRAQMVLVAATSSGSASAVAPLIRAIRPVDRGVPLSDAQTIETFYAARTTMFSIVAMRLISAMGIMGVILTMVGLYGLVSYAASRRTREIGIRMAIGATAARVIRLILDHGMRPACAGVVAGLVMSVGVMRLLPQIVPVEHRSSGVHIYLLTGPLLLVVSLVAAFIPARRSAKVDPTVALRHE